jgi:uncharacterized repeat protein (TIGR01451 family)
MLRYTISSSLVFAALGLGLSFNATAQKPAAGVTSFVEAAQRPNVSPDPRAVITPRPTGTATIFTSRATFQAAFPGLPMETFEEGNAAAGGFVTCTAPLNSTSTSCGFTPGTIVDGVAFQDNPLGPGPDTMIQLGAGTSLNATKALVSNTFTDSFDIVFNPPVTAAGMDLISTPAPGQGPPDVVGIQIFAADGTTLIDSDPDAAASGPGNFWGVSSTTPIGRISILSINNQAEGVDNIEFAGQPVIAIGTVTSADVCAATPANNNSIIEPGEVVNFTIPLNAVAGPFTNVSGVLSSGSAGVTVTTSMGNYGNIASGGSASANYSILLDETVACQSSFNLTLNVTSTEGNFSFPISRNVGQSGAFVYNGIPLTIPDNIPAGASSTATVAGVPGPLTSVQVRIVATHTWVGDLIFTLTSPMGTVITLLDRPGVPTSGAGCSDDNINVTFQDGQPDPEAVCAGSGNWPVTTAAPVTPLSGLNGQNANGTWTLSVSDNAGQDLGTVTEWELILLPAAAGTCNVCVGADADVSLTKTAVAAVPLPVGGTITYTLTATNAGPGAAAGVVVTDTLPAGVTYVSNTCGATVVAPTLTWTIGTLANAASATCDINVTVATPGSIVNTASIVTTSTDPNPGNNTGTASVVGGVAIAVPLVNQLGLLLMIVLVGGVGVWIYRR